MENESNSEFWQRFSIPELSGEGQTVEIGDLELALRFEAGELWVRYHHQGPQPMRSNFRPRLREDRWSRWAVSGEPREVVLEPVLADLPLVIYPEHPMTLAKGAEMEIYTRVPVWIRIKVVPDKGEEYVPVEIPTLHLSKTWFGSRTEGELCYSISTKARRNITEPTQPYLATCPVVIQNGSEQELQFEKFCFRVDRLNLYESDGNLWAGETRITFEGEEQASELKVTNRLPDRLKEPRLITKARKESRGSLAIRTFQKIINEIPIIGR